MRRSDLHYRQYAIASLGVAELRSGAQRHLDTVRRERLSAFVDGVVCSTPMLPLDDRAGGRLGGEGVRLAAAGIPATSLT